MKLEIDADVQRLAEQMQNSIPTAKLVAVAQSLASVAPLIWGHYQRQEVVAMRLVSEPIS